MIIRLSSFPPLRHRPESYPRFEFHIHALLRRSYKVNDALFQSSGNVIFPNYRAVRELAQRMNEKRDPAKHPDRAVRAGHLNAMGLIDEIFHFVLRTYEESANPGVFGRAALDLDDTVGSQKTRKLLLEFTRQFPPLAVYREGKTPAQYLDDATGPHSPRAVSVEEMILLYFANFNPAFGPFRELFDDTSLVEKSAYPRSIERLDHFFRGEPKFGPEHLPIFDLLRAPILASPNSLEGQLDYIRKHWGLIIGHRFMTRILGARDMFAEDMRIVAPGGEATTTLPDYRAAAGIGELDYERFTSDLDWMPKVVIIAKNTFVWLDQLSKKYRRPIRTLAEIPDEELDQLARWNFTGLWLIGIWERSTASQTIKQMTGNPEAVASAYSLYDYTIANDLGGEEAFYQLRQRAWNRGIRLAGDMVPNHMGIFSRWVVEHPEYFIQSTYKPFPNYQFTGPNLSTDPRVDIRVEDGYWTRRDAAVVFQRVDTATGDVRYLYHGNDGTSMPWNDTAQLDFMKAEVREAVIGMIFHTARMFSIIRFDAAMVLTRKHFQRLWYPQHGTGGAIPSRSDSSLSREEFDRGMPAEFWREVVDRINSDLPDTLLLAEAFWLLEGYFVRTLGMHRVYNSAFMNMLKREENAKYRELIRSTLHYNPEILKRYVNFMSNPDEETAIAQFGRDDKYFGVGVMMVTLPGLPMWGHGQIEGFTEKYGMEYKRSYYDEHPDDHLVRRHEAEIFPLMFRRHLFSQVTSFELYDFIDTSGRCNENVFAYSNRSGDERALICYHNKYEETKGWIRQTVGKTLDPRSDNPENNLNHTDLAGALGIRGDRFYLFRDYRTGLEYLRHGRELTDRGLYVELQAFQYHVFLDFREIDDATGEYGRLAGRLEGKGVPEISYAMREMRLEPVHQRFAELLDADAVQMLIALRHTSHRQPGEKDATITALTDRYRAFLETARSAGFFTGDPAALLESFTGRITILGDSGRPAAAAANVWTSTRDVIVLLAWLVTKDLGKETFDKLLLPAAFCRIAESHGVEHDCAGQTTVLLEILATCAIPDTEPTGAIGVTGFMELLRQQVVRQFLMVHTYEGVQYFNKERFELIVDWLMLAGILRKKRHAAPARAEGKRLPSAAAGVSALLPELLKSRAERAGYEFEPFLGTLERSLNGHLPFHG